MLVVEGTRVKKQYCKQNDMCYNIIPVFTLCLQHTTETKQCHSYNVDYDGLLVTHVGFDVPPTYFLISPLISSIGIVNSSAFIQMYNIFFICIFYLRDIVVE